MSKRTAYQILNQVVLWPTRLASLMQFALGYIADNCIDQFREHSQFVHIYNRKYPMVQLRQQRTALSLR